MIPSKLADALNMLLPQLGAEVAVKCKVVEVESPKPNVRRFRVSVPATAIKVAPLTREDGLPKTGDSYPPDARTPPPEPDLIACRIESHEDHTETEHAALVDVTYERRVPVPPPVRTIQVLDYATRCDGEHVLLDGKGNPLGSGEEPVYLTFKEGEEQKNSAGIPFKPQHEFPTRDQATPIEAK